MCWDEEQGLPVEVRYANARELADAIVHGARADVFASASAHHPDRLAALGLVHPHRPLSTNRVVAAVPTESTITTMMALADAGTHLAIEVTGIPLGDYTRELLGRLDELYGDGFEQHVLANVVAERHTVDAVAACLHTGQADAAILYVTDVAASGGRLRAIEPPPQAGVCAAYVICALRAADQPSAADEWIDLALGPHGARILRAAGFGPPGP